MIVLQSLMCILILLIIPVCMGMAVVSGFEYRSFPFAYSVGIMAMMVSFELVTVPIILLTRYSNFHYVLWIYTPVMLAISAVGVIRARRTGFLSETLRSTGDRLSGIIHDREQLMVWAAVGVILLVILVLTGTRVIFDGDDAYYVVQSLIAQQKGTMYSSNPYTGRAASIDMRHALAVFPMWIAYIGKLTNIHTTILCHSVLPLVFIPLALTVYGRTGEVLLGERRAMTGYFVLFIEIFILFGRVSIYTPEAFLIARTWQGKAVAANILLPMVFLVLATVYDRVIAANLSPREEKPAWLLLTLINASAGIFSSLAVVLTCVITVSGGAVLSLLKRRIRPALYSFLCCIPGIIYMILYLYYTFFGWKS